MAERWRRRRPGGARGRDRFAEALRELGPLRVFADPGAQRAILLLPPAVDEEQLVVARAPAGGRRRAEHDAARGRAGGRGPDPPDPGVRRRAPARAETRIALPLELRNQIARLELEQAGGVGGVVLLDERWRHRLVGLVGEPAAQAAQPLLSELYYVERALGAPCRAAARLDPRAAGERGADHRADRQRADRPRRAQPAGELDRGAAACCCASPARGSPMPRTSWCRSRCGAATAISAAPCPGRGRCRSPASTTAGPLADIAVPEGDVVVQRQVLAQPGPELARHTWARLADGTPLITGAQRGEGWLVLVHTTANTTWSSLPLSGVFVEMLQRIAALAPGAGGTLRGLLAPLEVLDAAGHLGAPGPAAQPIAGGGVRRDRRQRAPSGRPLRRRSTPAPRPPARPSTSPRRCPTCRPCEPADLPVRSRALRRLRPRST